MRMPPIRACGGCLECRAGLARGSFECSDFAKLHFKMNWLNAMEARFENGGKLKSSTEVAQYVIFRT